MMRLVVAIDIEVFGADGSEVELPLGLSGQGTPSSLIW